MGMFDYLTVHGMADQEMQTKDLDNSLSHFHIDETGVLSLTKAHIRVSFDCTTLTDTIWFIGSGDGSDGKRWVDYRAFIVNGKCTKIERMFEEKDEEGYDDRVWKEVLRF